MVGVSALVPGDGREKTRQRQANARSRCCRPLAREQRPAGPVWVPLLGPDLPEPAKPGGGRRQRTLESLSARYHWLSPDTKMISTS
ncbi:hypothetical protein IMZ48_32895 [Candidatus Bathyarchaeota archaeon]|nr:hypothetical protein [Candidatus Bathyarchaeota archaeon]